MDAFDYSDFVLNSPLGRYDGNVYEALFKYAQKAALNDRQVTDPKYSEIKNITHTVCHINFGHSKLDHPTLLFSHLVPCGLSLL